MEKVLCVVIFMKKTVEAESQINPCKLTRFSITLLNTLSLRPQLMDLTVDQRVRLLRHCSRFSIFSNSVYFQFEQLIQVPPCHLPKKIQFVLRSLLEIQVLSLNFDFFSTHLHSCQFQLPLKTKTLNPTKMMFV